MTINNQILHPEYEDLIEDFFLMRSCFAGQRTIKELGDAFLSPTSGMKIDGYPNSNPGLSAYTAYKDRAIFYSYVKESIQSLLGTMFTKPPSFELPSSIKYIEDFATPNKEPLSMLLQRINQEQLTVGRVGLLADAAQDGGNPYIVTYYAESIIDWDTTFIRGEERLTYVCLDETGFQRGQDGWVLVQSFRLLKLIDGVYQTAVTEDVKSEDLEWYTPKAKGKPLTEIPFVFVNTVDLSTSPTIPPLIDLANMSIAIYRQSADYNQCLFYQAQPTLVRTGAEGMDPNDKNSARTGAGALVDLPVGGTLEFVEVSGAGLSEMRTALDTMKAQASVFTSAFLKDSGANSSGEALKVRLESASATLKNISLTAAYGLEQVLSYCLLFAGGAGVIDVSPNLDFSSNQLIASELKVLIEAKNAGAPISDEQIHRYLQTMDFTDLPFEEVMAEIEEEKKLEEEPPAIVVPPVIPDFSGAE